MNYIFFGSSFSKYVTDFREGAFLHTSPIREQPWKAHPVETSNTNLYVMNFRHEFMYKKKPSNLIL